MARFIVDLNYGQISEKSAAELCELLSNTLLNAGVETAVTTVCVDRTNAHAFYEGQVVNKLTPEQIEKFRELSNPCLNDFTKENE
jgi:hypothetical protein